jgi:hypothetical protein
MPVPNTLAHLVEQAHRFESRSLGWLAGFDRIFISVHAYSMAAKN